jgi:predicted DNA-binding transcriptional regulator YafY
MGLLKLLFGAFLVALGLLLGLFATAGYLVGNNSTEKGVFCFLGGSALLLLFLGLRAVRSARQSKATRGATHRTAWREDDDAMARLEEWKRARRTYLTGNELRGRKERALLHAAQAQQPVSIIYNAGETPGTQRRILPKQFFKVEGFRSVYVLAYDFLEQEDRTFKVRNIEIG